MRKIQIKTWKARMPNGEEKDENLLMAINVLLSTKKPEEIPRGIEKFQIFGKIAKAFDNADKTGTLELEEREYNFLKSMIENDVPSVWGMNPDLSQAILDFLEAKDE